MKVMTRLKAAYRALKHGSYVIKSPGVVEFLFGKDNTIAGKNITPNTAKNVVAVMGAVRLISETVASLPLILYQRVDGGKERADKNPLFNVLRHRPNRFQTSFEWKVMMTAHLLLRGNAYSEIISTGGRAVDELIPRHPDRIMPFWHEGVPAYWYQPGNGPRRVILHDEMFHLRDLSDDGLEGESRIIQHRESIGLGAVQDELAARSFSQGAHKKGMLSTEQKLSPDARDALKKDLKDKHEGSENAYKTLVLDQGLKWQSMGMSAVDAQLLQSRKFSILDVARIFRIPPHMLAELEDTNRSTSEQTALDFLMYTLRPWLCLWEETVHRDLIVGEGVFAEFLIEALLRADFATRMAGYAIAKQWGWMNTDEIRAKENMNPLPDGQGQIYLSPMNMTPTEQLVTGMKGLMEEVKSRSNGEFPAIVKEVLGQTEKTK